MRGLENPLNHQERQVLTDLSWEVHELRIAKNSNTRPNTCLAITPRIPCKTDARFDQGFVQADKGGGNAVTEVGGLVTGEKQPRRGIRQHCGLLATWQISASTADR